VPSSEKQGKVKWSMSNRGLKEALASGGAIDVQPARLSTHCNYEHFDLLPLQSKPDSREYYPHRLHNGVESYLPLSSQ